MSDTAAVLYPPQAIPKVRKPRQPRINKGLAGVLAANTKQTWDEIAPQVGAKNGNSLKVSMFHDGLTKAVVQGLAENKVKATLTAQVVTEASEIIKGRLNDELMLQTEALSRTKPEFDDLASKGQGRAATVKQIAETWRTINGNPDQITVQFGANMLSDFTPSPLPVVSSVPITDVESSIIPLPVQGADGV